tara:strand:- start:3718 stop:4245 length:528 start_codon:yes stop_codon:yes gene_type:complete
MEKQLENNRTARHRITFAVVAVVFIVADWVTKRVFQDWLDSTGPIEVVAGLRFILVHNHGAAFGFLSSAGGWQRGLFISVAVAVMIYLARHLWVARPEERAVNTGFAMILGGAAGNLIDRVQHGYVIDFIDIHFKAWHWPAFNVADSAITIGAAVVILDSLGLFRKKSDRKNDLT